MGLWHDIKAMDALLARASTHEGSAASEQPVSTGIVADHTHTSHATERIDVNPHFVPGVVVTTSRTVAAHSCEWCKVTPVGILHMSSKDGRL